MISVSVKLTEGNIKNNHIYLASIIDFFPKDAIGGSNKSSLGKVILDINYGEGISVKTDIDGSKKIFRARSWVAQFIETNNLRAGDFVGLEKTGNNMFKIYPIHDR